MSWTGSLSSLLEKVTTITTDGSGKVNNLAKATRLLGKENVRCIAHTLQLVQRDVCAGEPSLVSALGLARRIIGKVRKSTVLRELIGRLATASPTRFDSSFISLQILLNHRELLEQAKDAMVDDLEEDVTLFLQIVDTPAFVLLTKLLRHFYGISDLLSLESTSTVALVVPALSELRGNIANLPTNLHAVHNAVQNAGVSMAYRLGFVFERGSIDMRAFLLHPASLNPRLFVPTFPPGHMFAETQADFDAEINAKKPPPRPSACTRVELASGVFVNLNSDVPTVRNSAAEEWSCRPSNPSDVLRYFALHGSSYPLVTPIAAGLLGIPATELMVERLFSQAGRIVNPHRSKTSAAFLESQVLFSDMLRRRR